MHAALAAEVSDAFAEATHPQSTSVSVETYDDEGANETFRGTHWKDHTFAELENRTSCLSFFTAQAFCFFLPAYLLAAIENPESAFSSEIAHRLVPPKNDPSRPSYLAWWSQLTARQREVVISFLKFMQSKYRSIPGAKIEMLQAYRVA